MRSATYLDGGGPLSNASAIEISTSKLRDRMEPYASDMVDRRSKPNCIFVPGGPTASSTVKLTRTVRSYLSFGRLDIVGEGNFYFAHNGSRKKENNETKYLVRRDVRRVAEQST